jgi:hypothetical protein
VVELLNQACPTRTPNILTLSRPTPSPRFPAAPPPSTPPPSRTAATRLFRPQASFAAKMSSQLLRAAVTAAGLAAAAAQFTLYKVDPTPKNAVCLDGTPGAFYVRSAAALAGRTAADAPELKCTAPT